MDTLKNIGVIIGSLIALIMAFIGFGGLVSSFRKMKQAKKGAVTELLIAAGLTIVGVCFLVYAGFYFEILSLEFLKIFFMIFTPMVLAVAVFGCFKNGNIAAGIICILVLAGLVCGAYIFAFNNTKGSETDAIVAAQMAVQDELKVPSSAKFSPSGETVVNADGDTWTVEGWVEAENSFGATVRNEYKVVITFLGKGQYTVDSVIIK